MSPSRPPSLAGRYAFTKLVRQSRGSIAWIAVDQSSGKPVVALAQSERRTVALSKLVGVRHPHLASVFEVLAGVAPEQLPVRVVGPLGVVIVEHVEGTTVKERLRRGPMQPGEAAQCFARAAAVLKAVHAAGAHHGAVSCENVILEPRSGVRGPVLGMLAPASGAYCSPERAAGGGPCANDDVWALHASLFSALAGVTPFAGASLEAVQASIRAGQLRDLAEHGVTDSTLRDVVERGLLLDGGLRCSDANELERALTRWIRRHGASPAIPERFGQGRRSALSLGAIAQESMQHSTEANDEEGPQSRTPRSAWRRQRTTGSGPRRSGLRRGLQAASRPGGAFAEPEPVAESWGEPWIASDEATLDDASAPSLTAPRIPVFYADSTITSVAATSTASVRNSRAGSRHWMLALIPAVLVLAAVVVTVVAFRPFDRWLLPSMPPALSIATVGSIRPTAAVRPGASTVASVSPPPKVAAPAPAASVSGRPPVRPVAAPVDRQTCVASFFENGSFVPSYESDLAFLCQDRDFRGINSLLERVLVSHGAGKVTPAMIVWSNLGWYQMAAAAAIRGRCCPSETAPIKLPQSPPPCDELGEELQKIARRPRNQATADQFAKDYAGGIYCFYMNGIPRPYHYRKPPGAATQDQFVRFLQFADRPRDAEGD